MVSVHILSGSRSGQECMIERFPSTIGRGVEDQIRIQDTGVWDKHLELTVNSSHQIAFKINSQTLGVVNGAACPEGFLMNGDVVELGAVRLRFWLAGATQRSFSAGEWITWLAILAISLFQLALIRWLR